MEVLLPFCGKSVSLLCDPLEPFTAFHGHHLKMQAGTGRPGTSVECRPEAERQVKSEGLER